MGIPNLSIIMPVFNAGRYVGDAIQSILNQTFAGFELILVDDASTDGSTEIAGAFRDDRIRILSNEQNRGIAFSRNRGLQEARGRYIAAFDADDVAMPAKFEKQVRFLESNPSFGMVGSWAGKIDQNGQVLPGKWKLRAKPSSIPSILLFRNYFCHSAVVMKREAIPAGGYDTRFRINEDYNMWIQIARQWKVWNLPAYLVHYRVHPAGITSSGQADVEHHGRKVYQQSFRALGLDLDPGQMELLQLIKSGRPAPGPETLARIGEFLQMVIGSNAKSLIYDQSELRRTVLGRWLKMCLAAEGPRLLNMLKFMRSGLFRESLFKRHE
jgi:hypothetical protein